MVKFFLCGIKSFFYKNNQYIYIYIYIILSFSTNIYARSLREFGDIFRYAVPVLGFGMTLKEEHADGSWDYEGTKQFSYSIMATMVSVELLKPIVGERRPDGTNNTSFPSGHAAGAFQGAFFIHRRYGWRPAILPYALSIVTAYSRVEAKKHYIHDVVVGAAIAGLYTLLFVDSDEKQTYKRDKKIIVGYDNGIRVGMEIKY
ncbi:MAG: phosphatase PAP2 family protein [Rickettsiales bacterium]|jgi:membrane-associated phospholipid phosphatase|nr:phosphatase PAP2 family protein [Rickettsiales bacterium]